MTDGTAYEIPRFLLQEGNRTFLLEQDEHNYYVIEANRNLTWETEELLLRYGVTKEKLDNFALKYRTMPKTEVRGIALSGHHAGNVLYFYLRSQKKIRYLLSDDCSEEMINAFFKGVERFLAPVDQKKERLHSTSGGKDRHADSWKKEQRDPELLEKLKFVSPALTVVSILCTVGYMVYESWLSYLGCLLCIAASAALDILYPAYFTLIPPGKGKKADAWELYWSGFIHMFILLFMPNKNWLDEKVFYVAAAICTAGSALLLGLFAEEFKRSKANLIAVCLLCGIFGAVTAGHINEIFDFTQPRTYVLAVEDTYESSRRRNKRYECTVTLPDGREVDLEISRSFYNELEIGDPVRVEHGVGALGIEYANAYPVDSSLMK